MALTNDQITAKNFKEFYNQIYPYLNGAAHAGYTPVGTVISVMGNAAPQNYLACNGQVVNIVDYPELAAYFAAQFGSANNFGGDGTTNFGIPDLRGEFLRGTGTNSHTDQGDGANVGVHQDATGLPTAVVGSNNAIYILNQVSATNQDGLIDSTDVKRSSVSADESSGGKLLYSRPTNTSVLYCIATKDIYVDARYDYSLTEKVVGTWIDGKPLYQKTVDCGALPNKTIKNTAHNIANIGHVIEIKGFAESNNMADRATIPIINDSNANNQLSCYASSTNIVYVARNIDLSVYTSSYITLLYTKTTD